MKIKQKKIFSGILFFIGIITITCGIYLNKLYKDNYYKTLKTSTYLNINTLYKNKNEKLPLDTITLSDIDIARNKISYLEENDEKKKMLKELENLEEYVIIRDDIAKIYKNGILNSTTKIEEVNVINEEYNTLEDKYKKVFKNTVKDITNQKKLIDEVDILTNSMFLNNNLKEDVSWELYNRTLSLSNNLKQEDLKAKQINTLGDVKKELDNRDQERKRREKEAINNAWVKLSVPYISQNLNGVLNGCEAASLLMGLQYKGYLKDMDLKTYATNMPKSDDPYKGFTYSIFGYAPNNVAHWIAPAPLARFGISTSNNNNIIDATGYSLDMLDKELEKGNPVVIYATSKFKPLKKWSEGAPKNIHVMLLTGYNKITGNQIITDPWTEDDGSHEWNIPKNTLESKFNEVGKKAVIIG